mmetsp:Transcript_12255/g.51293  ORF Transcript_12255/g.51293 Transcript_12255/m.51293 type:complete len:210 (+) Transcript_12255:258-887(+)
MVLRGDHDDDVRRASEEHRRAGRADARVARDDARRGRGAHPRGPEGLQQQRVAHGGVPFRRRRGHLQHRRAGLLHGQAAGHPQKRGERADPAHGPRRVRQRVPQQHARGGHHDPHPAEVEPPGEHPQLAADDSPVVLEHIGRNVHADRHVHQPGGRGHDARAVPGRTADGSVRALRVRRAGGAQRDGVHPHRVAVPAARRREQGGRRAE